MTIQLPAALQSTHDLIFQHPISRNLEWQSVRSLLEWFSDSQEQGENVSFTRHGQTLLVRRPLRKTFSDVQQLMRIRDFIATSTASPAPDTAPGEHLLVVIDERMARVYRTEMEASVPQSMVQFDRSGTGRHLHRVADHTTGHGALERRNFYTAVARTLRDAETILVFGSGTDASHVMDQLLVELHEQHQDLARRVVRTVVVDEPHLTEDELLAKSRKLYAESATNLIER